MPEFTTDTNYTVEEASRWLSCAQPVPLALLQRLGKDCSMVARIRGAQWTLRPTPKQRWPNERAYPVEIIREVFLANPETAPYVPKVVTCCAPSTRLTQAGPTKNCGASSQMSQ